MLRQSKQSWPGEEVEWLATTAYNHALDCYGALLDDKAREWASKAVALAHYCNDGGTLTGMMHAKLAEMNLSPS